jgi:hypothetical protein
MNDADKTIIEQVLRAAGKAGEQGFDYLVHWKFVDGVTSLAVCFVVAVGIFWLLRVAFNWRDAKYEDKAVRGVAIVALCIAALVCMCVAQSALTDILAPEGGAIYAVLHH